MGPPRPYHPIHQGDRAATGKESRMRIEVKGRNFAVDGELRERVEKRFEKVARQVSDLARLELELIEERNPAIPDSQVCQATLYLKGVTLRARESSGSMQHAIREVADELTRQ